MNNNFCEVTIAARAENVALARLIVGHMLSESELTLSAIDEVKVAISEAVSNAIIHGYDNDAAFSVRLGFVIENDILSVEVQDWGRGIEDIPKAMEPEYSRLADHMGLGFCFMQNFMDSLKVESAIGKGTTIYMAKNLEKKPEEDM